MKKEYFEDMVCEFVQENFEVTGCKSCHETGEGEITPEDYNGSWDKAINELYERIVNNRIPVTSSNLEFVGYNQEKQELTVYFKNRKSDNERYTYSNVPVTVFGELMEAESKGRYFQRSVRNVFDVKKID